MIYRGKVTAVTATTATVLVTDLDPVQSFGPLSCVGAVPAVGDIVLVVEVGDTGSSLPDLVVVNPTTKTQLDAKVDKVTGTDNRVIRYDGTTAIQSSAVSIDDSGNISTSNASGANTLSINSTDGNARMDRIANGATGNYAYVTSRTRWNESDKNEMEWGLSYDGSVYLSQKWVGGTNVNRDIWNIRPGGTFRLIQVGGTAGLEFASGGPRIMSGTGSPESAVTAPVGSLWLRTDGSTSTTLYVKTSGTGNTGWTAK